MYLRLLDIYFSSFNSLRMLLVEVKSFQSSSSSDYLLFQSNVSSNQSSCTVFQMIADWLMLLIFYASYSLNGSIFSFTSSTFAGAFRSFSLYLCIWGYSLSTLSTFFGSVSISDEISQFKKLLYAKQNVKLFVIRQIYIKQTSMSHTQTGANQYGFYAVPKALQPKKKYRQNVDDQYEQDEQQQEENVFAQIEKDPENERSLQRDYYVDEAPYPEFKPKERGLDYGVQIQRGDLFDYEMEVRPLVQILVGRSVVSAINELQEEKEKNQRKSNLDKYQKKRNAELMVTQRLEAKDKRKNQEADRRRLQKQIFIKNQKLAGKKLIARKNAKGCLLGLKNDLFNELEDAGHLRSEPTSDLKIRYEEWLYERIIESLAANEHSLRVAEKLIIQEQKKIEALHQQHINREIKRRQDILDERERIRKENEQRKQKKRIRKMRLNLHSQRQPNSIKFSELMERYEQVQNIVKHPDRSNGFSRDRSAKSSVYIAGGLQNFLIALLQNSGKTLSALQIQGLIDKILKDSPVPLELSLSPAHYDKVQQIKKRMEENKQAFMKNKDIQVEDLAKQISLDLSLLESTGISIKSHLHQSYILAILSIYLTVQPQHSEEEQNYELTDKDKKRIELRDKIQIVKNEENFVNRLNAVDQILRVRFEKISQLEQEEQSEKQKSIQMQSQKKQQEWINIYDGQAWAKIQNDDRKECVKTEQTAASYQLAPFENTFVYDQRTLFYLQGQLQKLLELQGGEKMSKYREDLSNIKTRIKKDLPVYDTELNFN